MRWMALSLFFLVACQHKVIRQQTGLDAKAFWSEQSKRNAAFEKYAAKLNLRYEGKKETVSGRGTVIVDNARGVRMELHDPLGRLHYVLTQSEKRVTALYPREAVAYIDSQNGTKYFERFLGLTLSVEDLRSLWLGIAPNPSQKPKLLWSEDDYVYVTDFSHSGSDYHVEVDPDTAAILKLVVTRGANTFQVQYTEFEIAKAIHLAHGVGFLNATQGTKIEVEWDTFSAFPPKASENLFESGMDSKVRQIILK